MEKKRESTLTPNPSLFPFPPNPLPVLTPTTQASVQRKVVSDSPGLEDFAFGLVIFVLNLPDGQVLFFWEIQITEGLLSILPMKKGIKASYSLPNDRL